MHDDHDHPDPGATRRDEPAADPRAARRAAQRVDRLLDGTDATAAGDAARPDGLVADDLELAAAALAAALHDREDAEPLPAALAARAAASMSVPARDAATRAAVAGRIDRADREAHDGWRIPFVPWLGWMAAAACLFYAIVVSLPEPVRTLEAQRAAFIERAGDEVLLRWQKTDHPAGEGVPGVAAQGDVVWSPELGAGFARFCHLAENDPDTGTYQIWMIDPDRADARPVSAGLFDVANVHEWVTIELDPALPVGRPVSCTVTFVPPGGVVVPDGTPVVLTATLREVAAPAGAGRD